MRKVLVVLLVFILFSLLLTRTSSFDVKVTQITGGVRITLYSSAEIYKDNGLWSVVYRVIFTIKDGRIQVDTNKSLQPAITSRLIFL